MIKPDVRFRQFPLNVHGEVLLLRMPHILACVWFLLHQLAEEGSLKKTKAEEEKKFSSGK